MGKLNEHYLMFQIALGFDFKSVFKVPHLVEYLNSAGQNDVCVESDTERHVFTFIAERANFRSVLSEKSDFTYENDLCTIWKPILVQYSTYTSATWKLEASGAHMDFTVGDVLCQAVTLGDEKYLHINLFRIS